MGLHIMLHSWTDVKTSWLNECMKPQSKQVMSFLKLPDRGLGVAERRVSAQVKLKQLLFSILNKMNKQNGYGQSKTEHMFV